MVPIGVQLYSLRAEPEAELASVLERLARMGYSGVEPAGFWGESPARFRESCRAAGLAIPAAHASPGLRSRVTDAERCFAAIAELGTGAVVIPEIPLSEYATQADVDRIADQLNQWSRCAARFGLRLGYHNHEWEFERQFEGTSVHRRLFDQLESDIFAEIDVYWAQVGGADPAREVARLGSRARLLHLKDGPAADVESPMTALGAGAVDLASILVCSHAVWHIVEIDVCAGDLWQALAESVQYLRGA